MSEKKNVLSRRIILLIETKGRFTVAALSRNCSVVINLAGINYAGVRHTTCISYGGNIDRCWLQSRHETRAKERVAGTAPPTAGNATRDAEIGTSRLTPNPHPRRIVTIRRPEYFTGFNLLGQKSEAPRDTLPFFFIVADTALSSVGKLNI